MTRRQILAMVLAILLSWCSDALAAQGQEGQSRIRVEAEIDPPGKRTISICSTPLELFGPNQRCSYEWKMNADAYDTPVKRFCDELMKNAPVVAKDGEWILSRRSRPQDALFLINCNTNRAWSQAYTSSSKATENNESVAQSLQGELNKQSARALELEKKLAIVQRQLFEESRKNGSCYRIDDRYQGNDEVTIVVSGFVLRFLKVKPRERVIAIGLAETKAKELLAEVQAQTDKPVFPHIYLAVPEALRVVQPFFLQDRLIDPLLYSHLTNGKEVNRVSYQDVSRFIAALNTRCTGRATFDLPSEEQFVAAAHHIYDPVVNGLKPCETLRNEDVRSGITELFGYVWQLTRSPCKPFSESPKMSCPEGSYVRKGGAASSTTPLECMPEYRSPAPSDVNQNVTSFRLVLVE